jgi:sulfite exporter TauE/SafE
MLIATDVVQLGPTRRPPAAAYHLGRALAYAALGLLAGGLGAALDLGAAQSGFGRVAGLSAAVFVAIFGVSSLLGVGDRLLPRTPSAILHLAQRLGGRVAQLPPHGRALAMGVLSAALPCGWLYLFVTVAAGTGSPIAGAIVMLAFWIGTVPALVVVALGARKLALRWPALRAVSTAFVAGAGIFVAVNRVQADLHGCAALLRNQPSAEAALATAGQEPLPCCRR